MSSKPAIQKAVDYLARFARTELQVRRYLRRKQFTNPEIDEAIDYLRSHRFLNDDVYARSFIESKIRKLDGPLKIKQMLFSKGIPTEASDRLLREFYPEEVQLEAVRTLIERKMRTAAQRERVMRFVASRGFPRYVIIQVFRSKPR